jgi:hypothetical protein
MAELLALRLGRSAFTHFRKQTCAFSAGSTTVSVTQRSTVKVVVDKNVATDSKVDVKKAAPTEKCGPTPDDDDLEELEEMFVQGPAGIEWNGPTRGGKRPEPTRFGDWERKGRASDF